MDLPEGDSMILKMPDEPAPQSQTLEPEQAAQETKPAQELKNIPRYSLSEFIDEHSKLLTAIGLFVALTAFSTHVDDEEMKLFLPGLALLGALVLMLELFMNTYQRQERQLMLVAFDWILLGILYTVGRYWFGKFKVIWAPLAIFLTGFLWLIALLFFFKKAFVALARSPKCRLSQKTLKVIWTTGLLGCMILAGIGFRWTMHEIERHQWVKKLSN